ncbi:MAG TPA: hypothetical protein VIT42_06225 [Microlunatus sp.]
MGRLCPPAELKEQCPHPSHGFCPDTSPHSRGRLALAPVSTELPPLLSKPPTLASLRQRYAATGQAQLTLLPSVAAGRKYRVLVLARPDVALDDVPVLRQAVAATAGKAAKPQGQGVKDTARRAESLLTQLSHATRAARLLPVPQIEPAHAKLLAEDLTEVVAGLATLAADLIRRSREHIPTARPD